jgi:hypothetical protein
MSIPVEPEVIRGKILKVLYIVVGSPSHSPDTL